MTDEHRNRIVVLSNSRENFCVLFLLSQIFYEPVFRNTCNLSGDNKGFCLAARRGENPLGEVDPRDGGGEILIFNCATLSPSHCRLKIREVGRRIKARIKETTRLRIREHQEGVYESDKLAQ